MNLLHALESLLGHPAQPQGKMPANISSQLQAHTAAPQVLGNNTPQASAYNANPQAPQFRNVDPAQFGYGPDNSGQAMSVQPQTSPANLGVGYMYGPGGFTSVGQGGQFNPGNVPLQNSGTGQGGYPQVNAFNRPLTGNVNPQLNPNQQLWQ